MRVLACLIFLLVPIHGGLAATPIWAMDGGQKTTSTKQGKARAKEVKDALKKLETALLAEDPDERIEALGDVADITQEDEKVPSAAVAQVLADAALEDDSLRVRRQAVRLLVDGQNPEVTVKTLVALHRSFQANMFSLVAWLQGKKAVRGSERDAMELLKTVMGLSGEIRDDRVAKSLTSLLSSMPFEMRGQPVAMAATRSLLDFGTKDAVQAVVRQFNQMPGEAESRALHNALTSFASGLDIEECPEFSGKLKSSWGRWAKKHRKAFTAKLGRWTGPESATDEDGEDD